MKNAFTMIELIFTIVIIGILASVAIPRLIETRDDAVVAILVNTTKNVLTDIQKYYVAQGSNGYLIAKTPDITNVPLYLNPSCSTRATYAKRDFVGSTLYICYENNPIVRITTTNARVVNQTVIFQQIRSVPSTLLSSLLNRNTTFRQLTNGFIGKRYKINWH